MKTTTAYFATLALLFPLALAQSAEWGQCGGIGWSGATSCVSGTTCVYSNPYYSQCLPGQASSSPTTPAPPPPTSPTTSSQPTSPTGGAGGLNAAAKAIGKLYFGSATDNPELTDTAYVAILSNNEQFGQITPANSMKWDATEPENGVFTFTEGDQIASFAESNGQVLRGHNCVWYQQLPSWVSDSGFTSSQLTSVLQTHVSTVVGHYKGQIYSWDVVNEPFNDDGTYRSFVFTTTIGNTYINIALQSARTADPNAKLFINDYNIESAGAKSTAMQTLVTSLKSSNVPIDGVGIEGHLIVGEVPSTASLVQNWEAFTALGVEISINELDIRMTLPSTTALLSQQETDYHTVISACVQVAGCVGVTLWDYTDKYSWVPSSFPGQGDACPWDANLQEKPAYSGILTALSA